MLLTAALALSLLATPAKSTSAPLQGFLPEVFAGWSGGKSQVSDSPQAADDADADVLRELGFKDFETEIYTRDGVTLNVRAMEFADASGALAAYTFYRREGMGHVDIGARGAWDGQKHILFWQSGIVVDATISTVSAMTASDLRELAAQLPKIPGGAGLAPPMLGDLPKDGLDRDSVRYAPGPLSYTRGGGVLPAGVINFARGEEAVTARYGDGVLTLINCPTPQVAAAQLRELDGFLAKHDAAAATQALNDSNSQALKTRRSGPLVVMTSGSLNADQASRLLNSVHYDADIITNRPQGYVGEGAKAARLLLGIAALVIVLLGITLILGVFFGGGRILVRRMMGKPATTPEEEQMIRLNLK